MSDSQKDVMPARNNTGANLVLTFWLGSLWAVGYLVVPFLAKHNPDPSFWQPLGLGLKYLTINVGLFCGAIVLVARMMELNTNGQRLLETQTSLVGLMMVLSGVYSYTQYQVVSVHSQQDLIYGLISLLGIILIANRR